MAWSKHSARRSDHWEISFFLIFDSEGYVRLTRSAPELGRNERSMAMTVKLPHTLFNTPTLKATIDVQSSEPSIPPIDLTAAAEALRQSLGVDVDIKVNSPEPVE